MSNELNEKMVPIAELLSEQNALLREQNKNLTNLFRKTVEQSRMLEVLGRATLREVLAEVDLHIQQRQLSMMETMKSVSNGRSLARWGDGEVKLMLQPEFDLMFQRADPKLASDLKDLLVNYDRDAERILLAFPTIFTSRLWQGIWAENWHLMRPILELSNQSFANTHVSRPLFFQRHGDDAVNAWREVWDGKKVCIVAGKGSKFELIPQLFDNAKSIERIDSLPKDAYSDITRLKQLLADHSESDIYLIALGPTGTVLAGWLASHEGGERHAIDVGHLASSYLNVYEGGAIPERIALVRET